MTWMAVTAENPVHVWVRTSTLREILLENLNNIEVRAGPSVVTDPEVAQGREQRREFLAHLLESPERQHYIALYPSPD